MSDESASPRKQNSHITYTDFVKISLGLSIKTSQLKAGDFWTHGAGGKIHSIEKNYDETYRVIYSAGGEDIDCSYSSDTTWYDMQRPVAITPEEYLQMVDYLKSWSG